MATGKVRGAAQDEARWPEQAGPHWDMQWGPCDGFPSTAFSFLYLRHCSYLCNVSRGEALGPPFSHPAHLCEMAQRSHVLHRLQNKAPCVYSCKDPKGKGEGLCCLHTKSLSRPGQRDRKHISVRSELETKLSPSLDLSKRTNPSWQLTGCSVALRNK